MSIFIQYDQWGRMGNRMFQYAFGHILATLKNCEVYSDDIPNFNIIGKTTTLQPVNAIYTKNYGDNYVDLNELLETDRDIVINSFLQRVEYYIEYRDMLRKLFISPSTIQNINKLIVHIRETDYTQINAFLGYEFYLNLIKSTNYNDVIIVTDNSNCETVQRLLSEGCKLNSEGYVSKFEHTCDDRGMYDFKTLLESENIAVSQSSYSWMAAFLGDHKRIIFPFSRERGLWSIEPSSRDVDLYFNFGFSEKFIL
jgi:hypothetical protein